MISCDNVYCHASPIVSGFSFESALAKWNGPAAAYVQVASLTPTGTADADVPARPAEVQIDALMRAMFADLNEGRTTEPSEATKDAREALESAVAALQARAEAAEIMLRVSIPAPPVGTSREAIVRSVEEWINRKGGATANEIAVGVLQAAVQAGSIVPPDAGAKAAEARVTELEKFLIPTVRDVLSERRRQVEAEGWAPEHDNTHTKGDLAQTAAAYAERAHAGRKHNLRPPAYWPWALGWWKPSKPRRNLIKAAALIFAEIDRLDGAQIRAATPDQEGGRWR